MQYDENAERYGYEGEMTPIKCDELKEVMNVMQVSGERIPSGYYKKSEVDEAITELKDAWRSEHEACEALKQKLENVQASMYCDVVDANMEIRRLKRALWFTRTATAKSEKGQVERTR